MTRPTLGELMEQQRRLAILRLLQAVGKYELSELVLRPALTDSGHPVSYKRIRRDLEWLSRKASLCEPRSFPAPSSPPSSRATVRTLLWGERASLESPARRPRIDGCRPGRKFSASLPPSLRLSATTIKSTTRYEGARRCTRINM